MSSENYSELESERNVNALTNDVNNLNNEWLSEFLRRIEEGHHSEHEPDIEGNIRGSTPSTPVPQANHRTISTSAIIDDFVPNNRSCCRSPQVCVFLVVICTLVLTIIGVVVGISGYPLGMMIGGVVGGVVGGLGGVLIYIAFYYGRLVQIRCKRFIGTHEYGHVDN